MGKVNDVERSSISLELSREVSAFAARLRTGAATFCCALVLCLPGFAAAESSPSPSSSPAPSLTPSPSPVPSPSPTATDADAQQRLADARRELDEAARRFSEILRERISIDADQIEELAQKAHQGARILAEEGIEEAQRGLELAQQQMERWVEQRGSARKRAILGVVIGDVDSSGLLIKAVSPESGSQKAGLRAGDKIVGINEIELKSQSSSLDLISVLKATEPGETVRLRILRDGEVSDYEVVTGTRDPVETLISGLDGTTEPIPRFAFGLAQMKLIDLDTDLGGYFGAQTGVLLVSVPKKTGFRSGDILLSVNDQPIKSARHGRRLLAQVDTPGTASVRREGALHDIEFTPVWANGG